MRFQEASLLLLPLLTSTSASPLSSTTSTQQEQSQPTPNPSASPALDPSSWLPIATILPSENQQEPNPHPHHAKLDLRQIIPGQAGAVPAPQPTVTQVSPVTTLFIWQTVAPGAPPQQVQVVYSQAFADVPDQWEGPMVGEVGLGTIKGEVGIVKTMEKRDAMARPTGVAEVRVEKREAEPEPFVILPPGNPGVVEGARLVKRKGKSGSASSSGGGDEGAAATTAISVGAPALALLVAVITAVLL